MSKSKENINNTSADVNEPSLDCNACEPSLDHSVKSPLFPKVIVSLTSFPARFWCLPYVFEALKHQTVAPDEIQLWLCHDEVDAAGDAAQASIEAFKCAGISIKWCKENLKPHNKYFWTMQESPDAIIITVDDDIIYPLELVERLLDTHYRHPDAVVSIRSHRINVDEEGNILPYAQWMFGQCLCAESPTHDLLATGVGGVLYPPQVFGSGAFDINVIKETSILADDMWLLAQEVINDIAIVNTNYFYNLAYVPGSQETGLYLQNLDNNRNDTILAALYEHFPAFKEALQRACAHNICVREEKDAAEASANTGDEAGADMGAEADASSEAGADAGADAGDKAAPAQKRSLAYRAARSIYHGFRAGARKIRTTKQK